MIIVNDTSRMVNLRLKKAGTIAIKPGEETFVDSKHQAEVAPFCHSFGLTMKADAIAAPEVKDPAPTEPEAPKEEAEPVKAEAEPVKDPAPTEPEAPKEEASSKPAAKKTTRKKRIHKG